MTRLMLFILAIWMLAAGCSSAGTNNAAQPPRSGAEKPPQQFPIKIQPQHSTVGLTEYVLITDDLERDRTEADAVIRAKIELPHAMQTKERTDFDNVLGTNFVYRGSDEFFDRQGYIANRVGDPSKVKTADYRNVVVQFITPDRALVTYSNIVEDQPGGPGSWKADMTWADVLVKEEGKWKYQILREIELRDLTIPKP